MNDQPSPRVFEAKPAEPGEMPLLVGIVGPPGGGKTVSALRLASGMKRLRSGPVVLIDTEVERSRKYSKQFEFLRADFGPPYRSKDFLEAVRQQLKHKPAAIIVDTLSDEHESEGGYIDWHDNEVAASRSGNEWAAWKKPSIARQAMIRGFQQIRTPLIFTFRAREKSRQVNGNGKGKAQIVNIGWQPVTSLSVMHGLDLTCILPPRAEGVPIWQSDKVGEDFIIKLPEYLKGYIREQQQLSEDVGELLASWQLGKPLPALPGSAPAAKTSTDMGDEIDELSAAIEAKWRELEAAAEQSWKALAAVWNAIPEGEVRDALMTALEQRFKPRAVAVERARRDGKQPAEAS